MAHGYIIIPDEIAKRTDLTPGHKIVLAVIGRIQGRQASCYPSLAYIGEAAGLSVRTVRRAINDLVKKKELVRFFHKRKTSTYSAAWATARNLRRKWAEAKTVRTA